MVAEHLNNTEAPRTVFISSWMPPARVRGTSDVLWSCTFTLSLCVYTAIHLNIPPAGEGHFAFWLRKTKWVLLAIFAPEIVVYTAFQQWSEAKKTVRELNNLVHNGNSQRPDSERTVSHHVKKRAKFDMTYGFYVVMGGFVTDVQQLHDKFSRITLNSNWIITLARNGHFIRLSNRAIEDKSKADVLAKCLVIAQVSWLIVNCIGRKVSGLPLTLLEIHTLVHVACALIMYSLWFFKPLDIKDPTFVPTNTGEIENIMALMIMGSPLGFSGDEPTTEASILQVNDALFSHIREPYYAFDHAERRFTGTVHGTFNNSIFNTFQQIPLGSTDEETEEFGCPSGSVAKTIESGQYFRDFLGPGFRYHMKREKELFRHSGISYDYEHIAYHPVQVRRRYRLSERDVHRWELAISVLSSKREEVFSAGRTCLDSVLETQFGIRKGTIHFTESAINLAPMSSKSIGGALGLIKASFKESSYPAFEGFLMAILPVVYGGIHMFAWHSEFPTRLEESMWKASCMDLVGSSILFWLGSLCYYVAENSDCLSVEGIVGSWFFFSLLVVNIPVYMAARIFLVVESFVSLRYVPIGVYSTVRWSNIIPHV